MTDAARQMQDRIRTQSPSQDDSSIKAMEAHGLQVIHPDAAATAQIRAKATELGATMRGNMVPADVYDMAAKERDAVRNHK
jgi:TRAP-type C4-dicarboxylate transport system substrate-binding protein